MFNRIKGILDMKSNTTKAKVQSKGRTPNSTNLRVKYFNPSPEKLYLDNRTVSNKELKQSQSKNNASLRMTTVGEMENLRLEMDSN